MFTEEEIKNVVNSLLGESKTLDNVIQMSIFVTNVGKTLIATIKDRDVTLLQKFEIIQNIGNVVVNHLEDKAIITLELAQEYREVLKNTSEYKETLSGLSDFLEAPPETKKVMFGNFLCSCIKSLLGNVEEPGKETEPEPIIPVNVEDVVIKPASRADILQIIEELAEKDLVPEIVRSSATSVAAVIDEVSIKESDVEEQDFSTAHSSEDEGENLPKSKNDISSSTARHSEAMLV
jgi:hypothetical protein